MKKISAISAIALTMFFLSCRVSAPSSGSGLIKTFIGAKDTVLYFINYFEMKSAKSEKLKMDFAYFYHPQQATQVRTMISVYNDEKKYLPVDAQWHIGDTSFTSTLRRIFTEPSKRNFEHRFETYITDRAFYKLMKSTVKPVLKINDVEFIPCRKWEKKSKKVLNGVMFKYE